VVGAGDSALSHEDLLLFCGRRDFLPVPDIIASLEMNILLEGKAKPEDLLCNIAHIEPLFMAPACLAGSMREVR
jgi:hypothetical protein